LLPFSGAKQQLKSKFNKSINDDFSLAKNDRLNIEGATINRKIIPVRCQHP